MNQTEQMLRNALLEIQISAEDCASGNYPWPHKQNYSDIAEHAKQALAAEPAPLVRLTQIERDRIAISCQSTQQVISATIEAMIAKNGGN